MELPGFEIIERIGEGAMAVVWKAHQTSLDRTVAIKVLKREFARDPREVQDFIQEARAAARVKHPNIVQVFDVAELDDVCYIVMECVDGDTLGDSLAKRGRIHPRKAIAIVARVAEALNKAWESARIVHRDIKPDNILIDRDGTVKLADLGLAMIADPARLPSQQDAVVAGTPNYMAPEQVQTAGTADCRSDMYSLGATLYHMVTGTMPFAGQGPLAVMRMQVTGQLTHPRNIDPEIPLGISQLIERLMMKKPEDRFKDWTDALKTIKKVATGRMLLGKSGEGVVSTVAPLKTRTGDAPSQRSAERGKAGRKKLPLLVQLPFWAALAIWLVILAYYRLPNEEPSATTEPPAPAGTPATTAPVKAVTLSRSVGPALHVVHQPTQTTLRRQIEVDRASPQSVAPYTAPNYAAMSAEERETYARVCRQTALHLLNGKPDDAREDVTGALRQRSSPALAKELLRLQAFLDDVTKVDELVTERLLDTVGQETSVHLNGKDRTVLLRAMAEDRVAGVALSRGPSGVVSNNVFFRVSSLDPIERSRWLGAADTPEKCTMKFLLYFGRGDYQTAMHFANSCGPFSETFAEQAGQYLLSGG